MTRQPAWKLNARLLLMALLLLGMGGYLCWGLNKLAVEDEVLSTKTHFILKRYKDHGTVMAAVERDKREKVTA